MGMIFAILKVIGIVLLALLLLVLAVCLAVVFVPVRYVVRYDTDVPGHVGFSASWLLFVVRLQKKMSDSNVHLYILGIKISNIKKRRHKKAKKKEKKEKTEKAKKIEKEEKTEKKSSEPDPVKQSKRVRKNTHTKDEKPKKRKKSFSFDRISSIITFIRDSGNQTGLRTIKKEIAALIRYLSPRRVKGSVEFGTGDPCTTGWVLGVISMFPAAYTDGLHVLPDFEEKKLDVHAYVKGRLRVLYFIRVFLRGYMDRETKSVIQQASNMFHNL